MNKENKIEKKDDTTKNNNKIDRQDKKIKNKALILLTEALEGIRKLVI
jgi:hypothetical protein